MEHRSIHVACDQVCKSYCSFLLVVKDEILPHYGFVGDGTPYGPAGKRPGLNEAWFLLLRFFAEHFQLKLHVRMSFKASFNPHYIE